MRAEFCRAKVTGIKSISARKPPDSYEIWWDWWELRAPARLGGWPQRGGHLRWRGLLCVYGLKPLRVWIPLEIRIKSSCPAISGHDRPFLMLWPNPCCCVAASFGISVQCSPAPCRSLQSLVQPLGLFTTKCVPATWQEVCKYARIWCRFGAYAIYVHSVYSTITYM